MIVDDEPFMRRTTRAMVRRVGPFMITEAENGEEALRRVAIERPDVVVCDISMAPMNGIQFVRHLRAHPDPNLRETNVVMLTVTADEATIRAIVPLRVQGYLVKPVSPKQISDRFHAIFRRLPLTSTDPTG